MDFFSLDGKILRDNGGFCDSNLISKEALMLTAQLFFSFSKTFHNLKRYFLFFQQFLYYLAF